MKARIFDYSMVVVGLGVASVVVYAFYILNSFWVCLGLVVLFRFVAPRSMRTCCPSCGYNFKAILNLEQESEPRYRPSAILLLYILFIIIAVGVTWAQTLWPLGMLMGVIGLENKLTALKSTCSNCENVFVAEIEKTYLTRQPKVFADEHVHDY